MPSDPARLSSTQVSFRIRLAEPLAPMIQAPPPSAAPYADAFGRPYAPLAYAGRPSLVRAGAADLGGSVIAGSAALSAAVPRRKARVTAVTWTGQAMPGDLAATQLLDAVRLNTVPAPAGASVGGGSSVGLADPEATQLLEPVPGWDEPASGGGYGRGSVPRQPVGHGSSGPGSGFGHGSGPGSGSGFGGNAAGQRPLRPEPSGWQPSGELPQHSAATAAGEQSRHAWHPGRRVDLGLVLLPLRVLLGSLSVYAGFSKLCDPVYFDGGERGSMMRWLASLHPWKAAQPLLEFAMAHPVGAGLGVAFTQIVVGVLSLLGLWQRLAAGAAMVLSAALLFTVSWRSLPVYDTPDLIFLAAWSPLLFAGAPFASLDGRLALEAWRRYGADAPKAVRRRVLRRGTVVASVVIGLTMLLGSMLGAAVRTGGRPNPTPSKGPADYGTPVWPAGGSGAPHAPSASTTGAPTSTPSPSAPPSPSTAPSKSPKAHASPSKGGTDATSPASGQSAGSTAGSSSPGSSAGAGNRAPKPSPSGGLIGGVLGSGPPAVQLPTLGMPADQGSAGRPPVV